MKTITANELIIKMADIYCKLNKSNRIKHLAEQEDSKCDMISLAQLAKNLGIIVTHKENQLFIIEE